MSACLSSGGGGAAAYSFELEKVKSPPSSSTTTTRATSPSSTLSESSNSPLVISTRKPRTPRKRPNQTYNEAAALLSTAYPNIFFSSSSSTTTTTTTTNNLSAKKKTQFYGIAKSPLLISDNDEASELLLPFESIEEPDFLFHPTIRSKSDLFFEQKEVNSGGGGGGEIVESKIDFSDEFDAESILDEEIEEGIDSIMGNVESNSGENLGILESRVPGINRGYRIGRLEQMMMNPWNRSSKGFKFAGKFPLGLGLRSALRENDDANWCRFHTVDFEQISPRIQTTATTVVVADEEKSDTKKSIAATVEKSKKKKKKKVAAAAPTTPLTESKSSESSKEDTVERLGGPMLKLDYDGVLEAWSDKASPFSDEILGSEATGADVNVCNTILL